MQRQTPKIIAARDHFAGMQNPPMRMTFRLILGVLALLSVVPAMATADTGFLNRAVTVDGVEYRYQVFGPANFTRSPLRLVACHS
jgi:hypothetical protein